MIVASPKRGAWNPRSAIGVDMHLPALLNVVTPLADGGGRAARSGGAAFAASMRQVAHDGVGVFLDK